MFVTPTLMAKEWKQLKFPSTDGQITNNYNMIYHTREHVDILKATELYPLKGKFFNT